MKKTTFFYEYIIGICLVSKTKLLFTLILVYSFTASGQIPTADLSKEYLFTNGNLSNTATSGSTYDINIASQYTLGTVNDPVNTPNNAITINGETFNGSTHPTNQGNYTLSFWLKTTDVQGGQIIEQRIQSPTFAGYVMFLDNTGNLNFLSRFKFANTYSNQAIVTTNISINDGNWHHIAITAESLSRTTSSGQILNKYEYTIYVDGTSSAQDETNEIFVGTPVGIFDSGAVLTFNPQNASGNQSAIYTGDFDNYREYTRILTTAEIGQLSSEFSIPPCIVNIPDANFKTALLAHGVSITGTGITNIDINNDGKIQCSEANAYTGRIDVSFQNISDLTGIEAFIGLTELNCSVNQLTSLDVSSNLNLTVLNCPFNQLTSLDVSNNTILEVLFCYSNMLTSLDVTSNSNLLNLRCGSNQLTNLDISNNQDLLFLNFANNQLTSLDVTQNVDLDFLEFQNNQITSIDISNNTALRLLNCSNNQLTNLNNANGNNANFQLFNAIGNSNLTCIQIDAGFTPPSSGWTKDATASYSSSCGTSSIYYVKPTATGAGDGSSWADANGDLQEVINTSTSGDQIFVATGTYIPIRPANNLITTDANNRDNAFVLKDGVEVYGGFDPDNGIVDLTDTRIFGDAGSILSGDFNDDDTVTGGGSTLTFADNTENAYHVVVSVADSDTTLLDGFTIKGGNADDINYGTITVQSANIGRINGGGMVNAGNSNPLVKNCTFTENRSISRGGGMFNFISNPEINSTIFSKNLTSNNNGGGICNLQVSAFNPVTIINSIFIGNSGGAILNSESSPFIHNSTFSGNDGGAIVSLGSNFELASPSIFNCVFWGNTLTSFGNPDIRDNTFSNPDVANCLTEFFGTNGVNGIIKGQDPLFVDVANADYSLQTSSPAINTGDNALIPTGITTDILGNQRIFNTTVDMGAYEFGSSSLSVNSFNTTLNKIRLYPNPVNSILNIQMSSNLKHAKIYSVLGAEVLSTTSKTINVSNLKTGVYLIRVENEIGIVSTKRFIKQ